MMLLISQAESIREVDCIVLAQASMAHLDKKIEEITGITVLSSPDLCLEEIRSHIHG